MGHKCRIWKIHQQKKMAHFPFQVPGDKPQIKIQLNQIKILPCVDLKTSHTYQSMLAAQPHPSLSHLSFRSVLSPQAFHRYQHLMVMSRLVPRHSLANFCLHSIDCSFQGLFWSLQSYYHIFAHKFLHYISSKVDIGTRRTRCLY